AAAAAGGYASPFSPGSRAAAHLSVHTTATSTSSSHSQSHSRCSTSGHPSPALSPLRPDASIDRAKLIANLEELNLENGARGGRHHHNHKDQQLSAHQEELEKARKRRARASLPAYFSNLMMGVAGVNTSSSNVPSTAVSSGTSSSDEQHQKQRKIRHVRSKSAMRASDRGSAKVLSTSASTFKPGPTRSSSGGSLQTQTQAQSPTTPTVLTRNGSRNQLLAYFNSATTAAAVKEEEDDDENYVPQSPPPSRGRDREKVRGRVRGINTSVGIPPSVEAIVSPVTATRHSMTPPGVLINNNNSKRDLPAESPTSFAEKHIRFIASSVGMGGSGSRKMIAALQGHLRSPPPALPASSGGKSVASETQSPSEPIAIRAGSSGSSGRPPLSAGILEENVEVPVVVPPGTANYTCALAPTRQNQLRFGIGGAGKRPHALTMSPKSRRFSSPTTSTAGIGGGLHVPVPFALMMSPAIERPAAAAKPTAIPGAVQDAGRIEEKDGAQVFGRGGRRNSRREEEMSPPRQAVVRRGWSPVRGRGLAVFDDDDDEEEEEEDKEENDDADEEEEEEEEEEPQRGRSRSRMRSR
ncbi:hypothetical protein FRB90_009998, partial [Tulasnella sp. 427]